jgi:hypothetical protein
LLPTVLWPRINNLELSKPGSPDAVLATTPETLPDGRPFEEGFLAAGEHVIERVGEVAGDRLIMDSPGPHPWPPRPPEPLYVNFD